MKPLNPPGIHPPFGAYSSGFEAQARRIVGTSGQLGIRPDGTIPADVEAQAELCFAAIDAILAEAGLGREHVLRLSAFVTARELMPRYMAVRDRWLAAQAVKPASTLIIVTGFSRPEFLVEIEALAAG
ncbi:MAG: RidA family protein [Amaricoccus sp.]